MPKCHDLGTLCHLRIIALRVDDADLIARLDQLLGKEPVDTKTADEIKQRVLACCSQVPTMTAPV